MSAGKDDGPETKRPAGKKKISDRQHPPGREVEEFLGRLFAGDDGEGSSMEEVPSPLEKKLRVRIARQGALSLHDYMAACVADPEHGYYMVRDPFGAHGDFITAPDICQVFGELLGLWCVHVWAELGQPKNCKLVELGPGRGALMADALRAASVVPEFLQSVDVHLVETSKALRAMQEEHIRAGAREYEWSLPALFWHDSLEEVPEGPTFLIANEFLDALPIRQFQYRGGHWFERMVTLDDREKLVFDLDRRAVDDLEPFAAIHRQAVEGDFFETCPAFLDIVEQMAARMGQHPLAGLFIDYGYGNHRLGDSFQAVRNHEFADPLQVPGLADVTAHVNFARFLEMARASGLVGFGPVSQRDFLIALGARERAGQLMQNMPDMTAAHQFVSGFQRLVEPEQMGHLFKVVGLAGPGQPELPGFVLPDETGKFFPEDCAP